MVGVDTNVLVRFVTEDDPEMYRAACSLFVRCEREGVPAFISSVVLCELVWTLCRDRYRFSREQAAAVIERLLEAAWFELENRETVREALADFRHGSADFADYLIGRVARRAGCSETFTFDRPLARSPGFTLLGADTYPTGGVPPSTIHEAP